MEPITKINHSVDKENFRVYIRALESKDYLVTYAWRNDPAYNAGYASVKRFISIDTEKRWIENAIIEHEQLKTVHFAIVLKDTDEFVGMISLKAINLVHKNSEVSAFLGKNNNRGKGYITEANFLTFEYAFIELGLERISAHILENNHASINSIEKFGFIKEGILRNASFKGGRFINLIVYSLLREEFINKYKIE